MSANYPGTNPAEEGSSNDNQPHVSYVKHLSSDENAPGVGDSSGGGGVFGWVQKVPGGWWTVGIGLATLIILFMTMRAMRGASTVPSTTPVGSNGSTDTTSGLSQDTYGQNPSAMDSQLSGLLSQEQINWTLLQQILNKPPTTTPTPTPPPTTHPPTNPPGQVHPGPIPGRPFRPSPQPRYVTVKKWPDILSTLSGIAHQYGVSLQRVEQLNPGIKNPNLIYAGQQIRIS